MKSLHLKQHLNGTDGKPILGYREKYGIHGEEILVQIPSSKWSNF